MVLIASTFACHYLLEARNAIILLVNMFFLFALLFASLWWRPSNQVSDYGAGHESLYVGVSGWMGVGGGVRESPVKLEK